MSKKLWGGRFSGTIDEEFARMNSSLELDRRLYLEDIYGSQAYAKALHAANLLKKEEEAAICEGLDKIKLEWDQGKFVVKEEDEDIHTANERRLNELIGNPALKLHTGRSRNDQIATDMKLWLRSGLKNLKSLLKGLIDVMVARAENDLHIIMPGYTHLQKAQPIRWSHWILSHAWSFKNDIDRLDDVQRRANVLPLGCGALAGNPFDIDREALGVYLGFDGVTQNSMQTVSDRDFVVEFLFWASLVGVHLTRLAEDLIIFSTKEFDFVTLDDAFSTGSSLMPQKRNPDSLELIRGVGATVFGECTGFMMVMKGLPSTYNKDLQNDKEAMFRVYDKIKMILHVAFGTLNSLKVNAGKCRKALSPEMLATDWAYYLVRKGVAFREAHEIVGKIVTEAETRGITIQELTLPDLKSISKHFSEDISSVWNYEDSIEQYQTIGGTSLASVQAQIDQLKARLIDKSEKRP